MQQILALRFIIVLALREKFQVTYLKIVQKQLNLVEVIGIILVEEYLKIVQELLK